MARPTVVKEIWAYIKANNLQDPADKRCINCDERLRAVMANKARVTAFEMNKYLSAHLSKPGELVAAPPAKAESDDGGSSDEDMSADGEDTGGHEMIIPEPLDPASDDSESKKKVADNVQYDSRPDEPSADNSDADDGAASDDSRSDILE